MKARDRRHCVGLMIAFAAVSFACFALVGPGLSMLVSGVATVAYAIVASSS